MAETAREDRKLAEAEWYFGTQKSVPRRPASHPPRSPAGASLPKGVVFFKKPGPTEGKFAAYAGETALKPLASQLASLDHAESAFSAGFGTTSRRTYNHGNC